MPFLLHITLFIALFYKIMRLSEKNLLSKLLLIMSIFQIAKILVVLLGIVAAPEPDPDSVSHVFTGLPNATHSYLMKWTTTTFGVEAAKSWCASQVPSLELFGQNPIDKTSYQKMTEYFE